MMTYEQWIKTLPTYQYEKDLMHLSMHQQVNAGSTFEQVATRYNVPVSYVKRWCKITGINISRQPRTNEKMAEKYGEFWWMKRMVKAMEEYPERFNVVVA